MSYKDEFFTWMENNGMKSTAARNYLSSINKISEKCLKERKEKSLYEINDISFITKLSEKFEKDGEYYLFGCERHGGIRASILKYLEFIENPESIKSKEEKRKLNFDISNRQIEIDNFGTLNIAFRKILPTLAEFVCSTLKEKDNENWWKHFIINSFPDSTSSNFPKSGTFEKCFKSLDIQICLVLIINNWKEIFSKKLHKNLLNWAHVLKSIRNDYDAHYTTIKLESFTEEEFEHSLVTMARFMDEINKEVADSIRALKNYYNSH